jgi:hypothetical protein
MVVSYIGLLLLCAFVTTSGADVTELNINPEVVVQGKVISIYGKASPNETVWITSSFVISLPVSDGKYSAEFEDIFFPPGEKKFSVTAENVEDIRVSLGPLFFFPEVEYPLDGPLEATNGTATIDFSVPFTIGSTTVSLSGGKDVKVYVKVYGNAAEDAEFVNLSIDMSIKVIADTNGDLKLDVNTGGIPLGEFMISAGAINKTVEVVSTKPVFDTGMSEDPYPGMCGIHKGTITPNQTITVSQLYTYSCPGTCGHTERVTIWNDMGGVIVEANWTGYRGDWRNMTFDAVTLVAGETYNYSFCTGSYPQLIHERTVNVTGGTITCSQFTDANGKVYIDRIPAIILLNKP